ncbi:hypothetical protein G5S52_12320 [Grimontia sp. S25]|uniref:HTH marR-type domain-containing protein n=1 Tax=Grimontia sedimenti TaxID=2711294 RepID=A0A6M1R7P9_9GAMM|nr:MarR family transcriptional regulator [Grimontia sedimenti]NGN98405.1 hypothetical protein [Grimontia sedimenti]
MNISNAYKMYRVILELKDIVLAVYPGKVSLNEFFVLQHISFNTDGCTQYELAKAMRLNTSRINASVKKLVTDEMVTIEQIDEDSARVKKRVAITEQGQALIDEYHARSNKLYQKALENLGYTDDEQQEQKKAEFEKSLTAMFISID